MIFILVGCRVRKGYEALDVYNYFEAKEQFEKGIKRNVSPSAYGLSQIYFRNDNPFHDVDSAYHYGLLAVESYNEADGKKQLKWQETTGFTLDKAKNNRSKISKYFFDAALESNTVMAMKRFIADHPWSNLRDSAIYIRDELAFKNTVETAGSQAFLKYINRFPESHLIEEAQENLHVAQFEETIIPNSIDSYIDFISLYPDSPYVPEAHRRIYQLATQKNTIDQYESYITNFSGSPFIEDAWKNLYRLSIADYSKENITAFREEHPRFPFPKMIQNDLQLVGEELFLFKENHKYGFMNRSGEIMIDANYSFASNFSNGLAVVAQVNKFGYIDKSGDLIIDYIFDEAQDFNQGRAIVDQDGYYGLIDPIGDFVLSAKYLDIGSLNEGLFYAEDQNGFQYYTLDGTLAFNTRYDEAFAFENGIAKVKRGNVTGFIRKDGSFIVETSQGDIRQFNDTIFILKLRDSSTFMSPSVQIGDNYFDRIAGLKENRAIVTKNGKYGYVDPQANVVIEVERNEFPNYFQFAQFENGHARVYRQGKYALMDSMGQNILPAIFAGVGTFGELIPVSKGEGWGYSDSKVRLKIDYQYDYAYSFIDGVAIVEQNGLEGLIDLKGETLTPLEYNDLDRIDFGFFIVSKQGQLGLINLKGQQVLDHSYQRISMVNSGLLRLEDLEGISYFDITKNELITLKK
jgi:hypothetical protein